MRLSDAILGADELAAWSAALSEAARRGFITQSGLLRYHGIPYGDSGRALRAMQAAGVITGPIGQSGERYLVTTGAGVAA